MPSRLSHLSPHNDDKNAHTHTHIPYQLSTKICEKNKKIHLNSKLQRDHLNLNLVDWYHNCPFQNRTAAAVFPPGAPQVPGRIARHHAAWHLAEVRGVFLILWLVVSTPWNIWFCCAFGSLSNLFKHWKPAVILATISVQLLFATYFPSPPYSQELSWPLLGVPPMHAAKTSALFVRENNRINIQTGATTMDHATYVQGFCV